MSARKDELMLVDNEMKGATSAKQRTVFQELVYNRMANTNCADSDSSSHDGKDDDLEEALEQFAAEELVGKEDPERVIVWEDNWDDDQAEDDFNLQLRSELESMKNG